MFFLGVEVSGPGLIATQSASVFCQIRIVSGRRKGGNWQRKHTPPLALKHNLYPWGLGLGHSSGFPYLDFVIILVLLLPKLSDYCG